MRTTTGYSPYKADSNSSGYKFKLMKRNFIQGHHFHLELSPYLLLVSSALLCTTLSGVMTLHGYSNEGIFLLLPGFFR